MKYFLSFFVLQLLRGSKATPAPVSIQTLFCVYFYFFSLPLFFSHFLSVTGSSASAKEHAGVSGWDQRPQSRLCTPVEWFSPWIYNGYRPLEEPRCQPFQRPLQFQLRKRLSWEGQHLWASKGCFICARLFLICKTSTYIFLASFLHFTLEWVFNY